MSKTRLFILLFSLPLISIHAVSRQFPTAGTALVLPGYHETAKDLDGNHLSAEQVITWEINHNDISFGAYPKTSDNEIIPTLGYMYNQSLSANAGLREDTIRTEAEKRNLNYEDFFLHFTEDTVLAEVDTSHGELSVYNRKPMIIGYTVNPDHAGFHIYQPPPWDIDAFEHSENGGSLFIYHSEKIDQLEFKLSQGALGGTITVEYPTLIDNTTQRASGWSPVTILEDYTESFSQDGIIRWQMPNNWVRAATHDGSGQSYGGGQFFGSTFLRDQGKLFVIKISWGKSQEADIRPRLQQVQLKPWVEIVDQPLNAPSKTHNGLTIARWRQIRGFDKSADLNKDGWLDEQEFMHRQNPQATSRYRWESRVIPVGRMWNQTSSFTLTNTANPDFINILANYYTNEWTTAGLKGAYNDDTAKLVGPEQFHIYSGGHVQELNTVVDTIGAQQAYQTQFTTMLEQLRQQIPGSLIGANIGPANLFGRNGQGYMTNAANIYLREHYLTPATGFTGYAGIAKFWDNQALIRDGRRIIFQGSVKNGRSQHQGNTRENWLEDQSSMVAIYYLLHQPGMSFLNLWNSSYNYGSGNTTASNFHTAGIAKNIAYQPTHLLNIDLGQPEHLIPEGRTPMGYMLATQTPLPADYTLVGNSTSTTVNHPDLPKGSLTVEPTYIYYLYKSDYNIVPDGPAEAVLARNYSKGMVVYRTDFSGNNPAYLNAAPLTINLPERMRPVSPAGNILTSTSTINLNGYQGLILLKKGQNSGKQNKPKK